METQAMKKKLAGINTVLILSLTSLPLYADDINSPPGQGPRSGNGPGHHGNDEMREARRAELQAMSPEERQAAIQATRSERQQGRDERRQRHEARRAELQAMSPEDREIAIQAAQSERRQERDERRQQLENMTPEERQAARSEHRGQMKRHKRRYKMRNGGHGPRQTR